MTLEADILELENDLNAKISAAPDERALEDIRIAALGKKGVVSEKMKTLGKMSPEERQIAGPALNGLKNRIAEAIAKRKDVLEEAALARQLEAERVDVTLPVRAPGRGRLHPLTKVFNEVAEIFAAMGFEVREGPDIEDDFHNFTALNFPPEHPAREIHDTFFFPPREDGEKMVLRTHTSPVQVRTMMTEKPPIRIIAPGRTFRCDSDQTHTPMFHQVEGLVIDKSTHMGHLKGTLEAFCREFFGVKELETRFRPHFFPFTEPSAEMDVRYERDGAVVKIGQGDKWMEILGSGMVHPNVLKACGLDPDEYQGFAFGMGIDRLAMLKYGIPDLRGFFSGDQRWIEHYGFAPEEV
ncbi:phenylalanine--tRNA ligase subunit alpha [Parvularcula lutaonensis]|uniref:Phenylalanine--tRNA ligase alpha subunit n=1 Tax=Parvularcula lutaonensis TaxID=491923 RepID=A0ABV7MD43_9PROT|nr:phenylalanine--tRNA ligase subunit alpha [Parvularcula lutaonensis]GGY35996.1 phenylalanine--tRNA ligase alpha subunit [Parvularcula lutaonensis]